LQWQIPLHNFRLASFLEENPNAVFIKEQMFQINSIMKQWSGGERIGITVIPEIRHRMECKYQIVMSLTSFLRTPRKDDPIERTHEPSTNPFFIGGFVEGIKPMDHHSIMPVRGAPVHRKRLNARI